MHTIDLALLATYMLAMLGLGAWLMRGQQSTHTYFVGDRNMGAGHIGSSIVATDVGGGFSIGLGGLGFSMGISGSWLLFTGLIGAWLAAVILVPRVKPLGDRLGWTTYPQYLEHRFDARTRKLAALVSAIGYTAFVGAQVLAGAKLAAVAFGVSIPLAVVAMAVVILGYTAMGGLKAVVYTDSVQWTVLLVGVGMCALPMALHDVGGFAGLSARAPEGHLRFDQVDATTLLTWGLTIVPIWFVANTLYQRIYASRDEQTARRAFYLAGLLEWPVMAIVGTLLGVIARVQMPDADPESGVPLLISQTLPVGATGLVFAAYFSAVMSTADSCLLAAVGHLVDDLTPARLRSDAARTLRATRILTIVLGALSMTVALALPSVLDAVLLAYAFMVSGLAVPTLFGLLWSRPGAVAARASMLAGGLTAVALELSRPLPKELDPVFVAMPVSLGVLVVMAFATPLNEETPCP